MIGTSSVGGIIGVVGVVGVGGVGGGGGVGGVGVVGGGGGSAGPCVTYKNVFQLCNRTRKHQHRCSFESQHTTSVVSCSTPLAW